MFERFCNIPVLYHVLSQIILLFLHMSSMKYIYKCGGKTIMENLCGKSVNNVKLEGLEVVCQVLKWIEDIQDKLLWLQ